MRLPVGFTRVHLKMKSQIGHEDIHAVMIRLIPRFVLLAVIVVFLWGLVYRPLNVQTSQRPHPDMTWVLAQQDLNLLVQPENLTLRIMPKHLCSQSRRLFLVIVVCSSASNFAARIAIRRTWASENNTTRGAVRVFFLLGRLVNDTLDQEIQEENERYGDIIQEDFIDTYNNLTVKSVMMLKFINRTCLKAKYLLKTDDDMFINVPNLIRHLRAKGRARLLLGCLISHATPVRDWTSKWYVPSFVFPEHSYPDYLSGTGYIMSSDLIPVLYSTALRTRFFYLEDIFITGIVAKKARVKPINNEGFKYYKRKNNICVYRKLITGHNLHPKELIQIWKKISDASIKCS